MTGKTVLTFGLLAFVAISVVYLVVSESAKPTETAPQAQPVAQPATAAAPAEAAAPSMPREGLLAELDTLDETDDSTGTMPAHRVVAYYFHNTQRCMTCNKIERLAEEALREQFAPALADGTLVWRTVNMEMPPNEHFVEDYQLVTSSLVLVDFHDGEQRDWTTMEKVWQLVHDDEAAFKQYVAEQAQAYLEHDA